MELAPDVLAIISRKQYSSEELDEIHFLTPNIRL